MYLFIFILIHTPRWRRRRPSRPPPACRASWHTPVRAGSSRRPLSDMKCVFRNSQSNTNFTAHHTIRLDVAGREICMKTRMGVQLALSTAASATLVRSQYTAAPIETTTGLPSVLAYSNSRRIESDATVGHTILSDVAERKICI